MQKPKRKHASFKKQTRSWGSDEAHVIKLEIKVKIYNICYRICSSVLIDNDKPKPKQCHVHVLATNSSCSIYGSL